MFEVWKGMTFILDGMRYEVQRVDERLGWVHCRVCRAGRDRRERRHLDGVRLPLRAVLDVLPGEVESYPGGLLVALNTGRRAWA